MTFCTYILGIVLTSLVLSFASGYIQYGRKWRSAADDMAVIAILSVVWMVSIPVIILSILGSFVAKWGRKLNP